MCPLCAHIPAKKYQLEQPYPLSWDGVGEDEVDGDAGNQEQQDGAGVAVGGEVEGAQGAEEGAEGGQGVVGDGGGAGVEQEQEGHQLSSTEEESSEDELNDMMMRVLSQMGEGSP